MDVHVCVGIYADGTRVVNYVADADLAANIAYNKLMRPGRYYFVDGEYTCGGILHGKAKAEMISKLRRIVSSIPLATPTAPVYPYM